MYLDAHLALTLPAGLERDALESVGEKLAPLFASEVARERISLAVASTNAGSSTAVRFWAEARRTGLGVASPELFPWCLANAACGALARRFDVRGPNFTYLGSSDALLAAIESAAAQFSQQVLDVAVVVVLELAEQSSDTGRLFAFRVVPETTGRALCLERGPAHSAAMTLRETVDAFSATLQQLDDGTKTTGAVTDGYRAFLLEARGSPAVEAQKSTRSVPERRSGLVP